MHILTATVAAAAPVTISLPTAVSIAAWIGAALLTALTALAALVLWFLRREIQNNDRAHEKLQADVQKLLTGDVPWVRTLQDDVRALVRQGGQAVGN